MGRDSRAATITPSRFSVARRLMLAIGTCLTLAVAGAPEAQANLKAKPTWKTFKREMSRSGGG